MVRHGYRTREDPGRRSYLARPFSQIFDRAGDQPSASTIQSVSKPECRSPTLAARAPRGPAYPGSPGRMAESIPVSGDILERCTPKQLPTSNNQVDSSWSRSPAQCSVSEHIAPRATSRMGKTPRRCALEDQADSASSASTPRSESAATCTTLPWLRFPSATRLGELLSADSSQGPPVARVDMVDDESLQRYRGPRAS